MNILLIFFAITFVVIVISIALQKILKCQMLVALIIFSVILLIGVILSNTVLIISSVFYAILSFIVTSIACIICRIIRNTNNCNNTINITGRLTSNSIEEVPSLEQTSSTLDNNSSGTCCGCDRRR